MGDGPVRVFGVSLERMRPGVVVDAIGIPGACARDQIPSDPAIQAAHLRRISPDLVVLSYGTNESSSARYSMSLYERELRQVIARIQRALPQASCLLIGPSELPQRLDDGSWGARESTGQIIEIQRRIAREVGCGFFDQLAFMGGPGSMVRWVAHAPPLAREDYTHYTREGHQRLAEVLERALLEGLEADEP
jgi:lysophospholipase L1-like esterase